MRQVRDSLLAMNPSPPEEETEPSKITTEVVPASKARAERSDPTPPGKPPYVIAKSNELVQPLLEMIKARRWCSLKL